MMESSTNKSLRLAFYGDDFTGSTDALEVLAFSGLRCALFLNAPTPETRQEFAGFDAIGIAGESRGMSPEEMDVALPSIFQSLADLKAPIVHYKVCSTFDSSPTIGSIGRVMEIGRRIFGPVPIPIVAGTPALARYCLFGNLFARSGTDGLTYRIDKHPIMSAHPVTPINESDLTQFLGRQTSMTIDKFVVSNFAKGRPAMDEAWALLTSAQPAAVLFDGLTNEHMTEVGRLLDTHACRQGTAFVVGSSGVEYALTQWWLESGRETLPQSRYESFAGVNRVLAISGSASSLSALQIDAAIAAGFIDMPIDASALVDELRWESSASKLVADVLEQLLLGKSVMLHTARGPQDPRIETMIGSLMSLGKSREEAKHGGGRLLGMRLGLIVKEILVATPLRRLLLSGGDTSSQITRVLAPDALEIEARLAPGAPLCRVISKQVHLNNLQIALKGGQMGDESYFVKALHGNI
jgi:uncharacterized protein YgbK (DUF1537 family)